MPATDAELDVDIVLHGAGALSSWAAAAGPGAPVAVAGTGRGVHDRPDRATTSCSPATRPRLAAIAVLLEALPATATVRVLVEVAHADARIDLPSHPGATVTWCDLPADVAPGAAFVPAVEASTSRPTCGCGPPARRPPCNGCGGTCSRTAGLARSQAVVRGYWKHGRAGDAGDPAT